MSIAKIEEALRIGDTLQVALLLHHFSDDPYRLGRLLQFACYGGFKNTEIFLDAGADVNFMCEEKWNVTPLMYACLKGHRDVAQTLLDRGADMGMVDDSKESALHCASGNGHLDTVKLLVEKGAEINLQDNTYYTPLHCACAHGHTEVAKFLLSKGADTMLLTEYGETALFLATRGRYEDIVELFKQHAG